MRDLSLSAVFAAVLFVSFQAAAQDVHVVIRGESLSSIAKMHYGNSAAYKMIAEFNQIPPPYRLSVGQTIRLPLESKKTKDAPADSSKSDTGAREFTLDAISQLPSAHPQEFILVDASGRVDLIRDAIITPLTKAVRIKPGDTLRTADQSRVLLSGKSGERVVIGENASFLLRELTSGLADRRIVMRMDEGSIRFFAPKSPFLTRYLLETPTGTISMRHGECYATISPPALTSVSMHKAKGIARLPMGELEIPEGWGIQLKTLERPEIVQPIPYRPGLILETAPRIAVLAAATDPGLTVVFEAYSDPDRQIRVGSRRSEVDRVGVAVARFVLPPGKYWFAVYAESADGLVSQYNDIGPVELVDRVL